MLPQAAPQPQTGPATHLRSRCWGLLHAGQSVGHHRKRRGAKLQVLRVHFVNGVGFGVVDGQ